MNFAIAVMFIEPCCCLPNFPDMKSFRYLCEFSCPWAYKIKRRNTVIDELASCEAI